MIYRKINSSKIDRTISMTKKEFYLILLNETHSNDFLLLLGQGISGNYCWYREAVPKYALNEFIFPSGWKKINTGELLIHESILDPFWVSVKQDSKNKIVLPISDKLLKVIGVSRNELIGKYNCAVFDPIKDHKVLKDYPL